ncbi:MAG TPA: Ig-like domain-containing protein [Pyrinomonadaceae bacterium]|nr:Ig-like domain-containing protein [Pyrinomonadaceae bacterium]
MQYPSEEAAFIGGPQLKSGSSLNPYPWFDRVAIEQGQLLGAEFPAAAPRTLTGTVSVRQGSADVTGTGTRFTLEVDPNGQAPYYGWLRVTTATGAVVEMRVVSVASDTRLTLTAPWAGATASGLKADTYHNDASRGWNSDRYYDSGYYDMALVQYLNYYRTGDTTFLTYARRAADSWWASPYIENGTVFEGQYNLPPRSMAYAGLMLRALDGRPEMWDYLQRHVRVTFDNWVGRRVGDAGLYYDIREDGYAQLYAVLLARVLPDSYPLYPSGTLAASGGTATDGAQKRAAFLKDTERAAVQFFGRLQGTDGSWKWDIPDEDAYRVEQPFMIGLYMESVVALDRITTDPTVKASLRSQLEKAVHRLYERGYRGGEQVSDMPKYRWRGMWYYSCGGTAADPTAYERGPGQGRMVTGGNLDEIRAVRHLNSTVHHAFGYAYALTGNAEYLRMGDEVFDASYGDVVDGIHGQADDGRGKDYAMNFRASGRYLALRLQGQQAPAPTPTPTPTSTPTPTPTPAPVAPKIALSNPPDGAQFVEPVTIDITADVTAGSGGVSKVEFYDGATLVGSATSQPYTFRWSNVPAGSHTLTAKLTDWGGATFTSASVTIRVSAASNSVARARVKAQETSNLLGQAQAAPLKTSADGSNVAANSTTDINTQLAAVVAAVQQAYTDFNTERASFPAAARIETELAAALSYARAAVSLSQGGGSMADVQKNLRVATDNLVLANVHIVYGDIPNPLDAPEYFVRQHYVDFLGREPDESGQSFWVGRVTGCGAPTCAEAAHISVSAAYFLSIEFQETGYLLYKLYRSSYGRAPLLAEFTPDRQELSRGVIVGETGWNNQLDANKGAFLGQWVQRPEFKSRFDALSNARFVDTLAANVGVSLTDEDRAALVSSLDGGATRASVLRQFVELGPVTRHETNSAFVQMQYFGYLQRDPDEGGYNYWLGKLESFGGDYQKAEMVKAFLSSIEYRQRFGRP